MTHVAYRRYLYSLTILVTHNNPGLAYLLRTGPMLPAKVLYNDDTMINYA